MQEIEVNVRQTVMGLENMPAGYYEIADILVSHMEAS